MYNKIILFYILFPETIVVPNNPLILFDFTSLNPKDSIYFFGLEITVLNSSVGGFIIIKSPKKSFDLFNILSTESLLRWNNNPSHNTSVSSVGRLSGYSFFRNQTKL